MTYRPKPAITPQQIARRAKRPMKAASMLTLKQLETKRDRLLGDDEPERISTTEEALEVLLEDFEQLPPQEQRAYRSRVRQAAAACDAWIEEQDQINRLCSNGEHFYAYEKRARRDPRTRDRYKQPGQYR